MFADGRAAEVFPDDHVSNPIGAHVTDWLRSVPGLSLNLGAGATTENLDRCVEVEAARFVNTGVVADAHVLPFQDSVFDAVVSFNTFEHLADPTKAADEIHRVLRPGGRVYVVGAFLQPVHEAPRHFFNATEFGYQQWFGQFEVASCEASGAGGPEYALAWLALELLHHVGLEEGWEISEQLASTTLGQWRQLWADRPNTEMLEEFPFRVVTRLSPEVRRHLASAIEIRAFKPGPVDRSFPDFPQP
jgi:SAM-dependent methyltransferase